LVPYAKLLPVTQWLKKDIPIVHLGLLAAVLVLAYFGLLFRSSALEGLRLKSADVYWQIRNVWMAPPPELDRLLLITIDDESQQRLHRKWPWDRSLYAQLLDRVTPARPSEVFIDLVFHGESVPEEDQALAEAIRNGPPVLLAASIGGQGKLAEPLPILTEAGARIGLINKPRDPDRVVRRSRSAVFYPGMETPLYAVEAMISAHLKEVGPEGIRIGEGLSIGTKRIPSDPSGSGQMAINYLANARQIPTLSFWELIEGEIPEERIRDKVLLIGSAREITHDIYATPLGLMPGVAINANAILTILSERFVHPVPPVVILVGGFFLALIILLLTHFLPLPRSALATAILAAVGWGVGLAASFMDFRTEFASTILIAASAWLTGAGYKYSVVIASTLRLHRRAITDTLTGALTPRYFQLCIENHTAARRFRKQPVSLILIQTEKLSAATGSRSWENILNDLRELVTALQQFRGRGGLVGRVTEDRFGLFLPGIAFAQAKELVETIREKLGRLADRVCYSVISSEIAPNRLGRHLLRYAEATLARAKRKGWGTVEIFDPTRDHAVIEKAGLGAGEGALAQLEEVAGEMEEKNRALQKALEELHRANEELKASFLEVTKSLVMAMHSKDAYTAGHLGRVSRYSARLAEVCGLPEEEVEAVREAALLHDIGKMHLPDEILHKVGKLTDEEYGIIKQHLEFGAKILDPMKFFKPITTILYHHHERYDGTGYPHGLSGDLVPIGAQILTVCDSFDAMTTNRGYNKPKSMQEGFEELRRGAGTQFNPEFVGKFIALMEKEGRDLAGYQAA